MTNTSKQYDVIIIGAGLAGLYAAKILCKQHNQRVLILEAQDCVGGRLKSTEIHNYTFDIGGQWIGPKQERMYDLCKHFCIQTFAQYDTGASVFITKLQNADKQERNVYDEFASVYPAYMNQYIKDVDALASELNVTCPYKHSMAKEWDSVSCYEWKCAKYGEEIAQKLNAEQGLLATNPKQISFLFWLYFVRVAGNFSLLSDTTNGAQQDRYRI